MNIFPIKAAVPNLNIISSPDVFFASVKEDYPEFETSGFFDKHEKEAIYIYRIKNSHNRIFTGLILSTTIEDFIDKKIKKHEKTLAPKVQMQIQLLLKRQAAVKPILLTYPNVSVIDNWMETHIQQESPCFDIWFEKEKQHHFFWRVIDPKSIKALQNAFKQHVPFCYIADGHHRIAANLTLAQKKDRSVEQPHFNRVLSAFFSASELDIHDFSRIVNLKNLISIPRFLVALGKICTITPLPESRKPNRAGELTLLIGDEWFSLVWKKSLLKQAKDLTTSTDVQLFNQWVLRDILHIKDIQNNTEIEYVEGVKSLSSFERKVRRHPDTIGFCLYPITREKFIAIADAHLTLPPKSTWFEPRMKNGLLVKEY